MGAAKLMPAGLSPRGLITKSATTAANQEMAILEYSPSTWPMAWEHLQLHQQQGNQDIEHHPHHPAGVAVGQLRKNFDHASEPA